MLTGDETALLVAMLLGSGITVGLVMMTLRDEEEAEAGSFGLDEEAAQFLIGLGEPMIFEPVGERDRDETKGQYE